MFVFKFVDMERYRQAGSEKMDNHYNIYIQIFHQLLENYKVPFENILNTMEEYNIGENYGKSNDNR